MIISKYKELENMPYIKRDTPGILFENVLTLVQKNGHYAEAEPIIDYALPEKFDHSELTNYRFDFEAVVKAGSNEGIIIGCRLSGNFDDSGRTYCNAGTIKTLNEDVDAYRIMGALSGYLTAYSYIYVNSNLTRFMPEKELRGKKAII